jgi:hypothetical protein
VAHVPTILRRRDRRSVNCHLLNLAQKIWRCIFNLGSPVFKLGSLGSSLAVQLHAVEQLLRLLASHLAPALPAGSLIVHARDRDGIAARCQGSRGASLTALPGSLVVRVSIISMPVAI